MKPCQFCKKDIKQKSLGGVITHHPSCSATFHVECLYETSVCGTCQTSLGWIDRAIKDSSFNRIQLREELADESIHMETSVLAAMDAKLKPLTEQLPELEAEYPGIEVGTLKHRMYTETIRAVQVEIETLGKKRKSSEGRIEMRKRQKMDLCRAKLFLFGHPSVNDESIDDVPTDEACAQDLALSASSVSSISEDDPDVFMWPGPSAPSAPPTRVITSRVSERAESGLCPFCNERFVGIPRHIACMHNDEAAAWFQKAMRDTIDPDVRHYWQSKPDFVGTNEWLCPLGCGKMVSNHQKWRISHVMYVHDDDDPHVYRSRVRDAQKGAPMWEVQ